MKKKIFIGVGILIVLIVVAMFYLNNRNRTLSPPGQAIGALSGDTVSVEYSRPSVRDRLIFGEEEEGALQPYGVYWRLGANEPTFLNVNYDFRFGDSEIDAGKYVIYAIPRKGEMELRLNADLRFWGFTEPDYAEDLATAVVRMSPGEHTEQFTISVESAASGFELKFNWGKQQWSLPLEKQ
ncbi:Protein of unknown function [Ekhidna lutea]|uniref:DUF2911 domain-containing protein n=1 Tax=Ekhidna lutea TaxID=447679 RepID=A0A239JJ05_EKHLU|nr:DUF2911 domain-containing protein [Ekhidna lutea]SNT05779.1 Protein of unknown function [Ekhidna lutea]